MSDSDQNQNKVSRIERVQNKLYSKQYKPDIARRTEFEKREYKQPRDWVDDPLGQNDSNDSTPKASDVNSPLNNWGTGEDVTPQKKSESFWMIFVVALIFFFGAIGYASYVFVGGGQVVSPDSIDINIVGPVSVGGGDKLSIDIVVQNNNAVVLKDVDLVVEYPDGTRATDLVTELRRGRISIGDINPGQVVKETLDMAFFGEEGQNKRIEIELEYGLEGSSVLFDKGKSFEIALSASPVQVIVKGLDSASSGQEIELEVQLSSNSDKDLDQILLVANYPFGFNFESADLSPTYGNNIWLFEDFKKEQVEDFKIKGTINAQDDELRYFRFDAGVPSEENNEDIGILFTNASHEINIERPFIDLQLVINQSNDDTITVRSGEPVQVIATFVNNTNSTVRDIEIIFELDGEILEKSSVSVGSGFYSSSNNTIIYNKDNRDALTEIGPRKQERISFGFDMKKSSSQTIGISDPEVTISAHVTGRRISEDNSEEEIDKTNAKTVQMISDVFAQAYSLYALGPFSNVGPVPPKVDNKTDYTILFSVSNSNNRLEDARITATVPPYISWKNAVSPVSENVRYDQSARQIIWEIGTVNPSVGYNQSPKEANIQLTLTPSISQVGRTVDLLQNIKFSARDTFTGTNFENVISTPTTVLQEQAGSLNNHEFVIE
jgi:hypothetical protein